MMRWFAVAVLVVTLAGCGDDPVDWQTEYRDELRADNEARDPVAVVQACAWIDAMTDEQLRQVWADEAGSDENLFNQVMADLDLDPTVDDYNRAIEIATEEARRLCR